MLHKPINIFFKYYFLNIFNFFLNIFLNIMRDFLFGYF